MRDLLLAYRLPEYTIITGEIKFGVVVGSTVPSSTPDFTGSTSEMILSSAGSGFTRIERSYPLDLDFEGL
jgi:hypothetical protein